MAEEGYERYGEFPCLQLSLGRIPRRQLASHKNQVYTFARWLIHRNFSIDVTVMGKKRSFLLLEREKDKIAYCDFAEDFNSFIMYVASSSMDESPPCCECCTHKQEFMEKVNPSPVTFDGNIFRFQTIIIMIIIVIIIISTFHRF
jgi:hypothetical protein